MRRFLFRQFGLNVLLYVILHALGSAGVSCSAQELGGFIAPLDIPISFSGTYGELRHDHFHAGVDFRTEGKIGFDVHAIKSGYVSRVSVSPFGYGNGVYITHPDGTMSVYGHLSGFAPEIAERVLQEQYAVRSFSVDLKFSENEFPVIQGDVIGKSGNTGSSGGPHLHMEIRKNNGALPLNYLAKGVYGVVDTRPPVFQRIAFYGYEDSLGVAYSRRLVMFRNASSEVIRVPHKSYIAIDAIDKMEGTGARLAVDKYSVALDGKEIFCLEIGDVPYSIDSYIRSLIQTGESGADMIKTQVDPASALGGKVRCEDGGLFVLNDYDVHNVRIEVSDCFGNKASRSFRIKRDDNIFTCYEEVIDRSNGSMLWFMPNLFVNDEMSYSLPAGSVYRNVPVDCKRVAGADPDNAVYSSVWKIESESAVIHKRGMLRMAVDTVCVSSVDTSKLVLAKVSQSGALIFAGGKYSNGYVSGRVGFGTYCVTEDNIAPTVHLAGKSKIGADGVLHFIVRDDFSGVSSCDAFIDGQWVLSMLKGNRLVVYIAKAGLKSGRHRLSVKVKDNCGNETNQIFNIQL